MPDTLNKQSLINLLIDSPLREPIKINLIDIVNNTSDPDLPKVYSTITKELEIFQKATERRMKLADETIAKLGGSTPATATPATPAPSPAPAMPADLPPLPPAPTAAPNPSLPPLDLPPLPTPPTSPAATPTPSMPPLSVPPLDLPPLPQMPTTPLAPEPAAPVAPLPTPAPLGATPMSASSDEDALAEIQKELDSLKTATAADLSADKAGVATAAAPATAAPAPTPQA